MRVLVVGGNGFLGSAIVKQALARQWHVVSISRSGKPFVTPAGHQPAWSASSSVEWQAADALHPHTYRDLVGECDAAISTTGILLESSYKGQGGGGVMDILKGLTRGWGVSQDNPLGNGAEKHTQGPRYEVMNRDAPLAVARTFAETRAKNTQQLSPFVYISAEDIFRPIISSRYIETKQEAERGLAHMSESEGLPIRPIFLRPGLMYHPQTRPLSTLPAAVLDLSSWLHHQHVKLGIPLPTAAALLSRFPGADLSALGRLLTVQPLHVDTVAKAACASLTDDTVRGAIDTDGIQSLAGFQSRRTAGHMGSSGIRTAGASAPWPSQRLGSRPQSPMGQRGFATSAATSRHSSGSKGSYGSSAYPGDDGIVLTVPLIAAVVAALYGLHSRMSTPLLAETLELTQQEQMRARAQAQGVFTWGSNRYNVVAPDTPLTTFIKTPRSIPYFDGMALRDLSMEERHAVAVDANGDVLQWGLGFFDASLENLNKEENIDDVPLARRREREKANELTPRGSLGATPMAPVKTLTGKNIVRVSTSDSKVYALAKNGTVYIFSAVQARQWPGRAPGWSWNPISIFGYLDKQQIDYVEMSPTPAAKFSTSERITDIKAGTHHLLALTSKGRTFSAPIDPDGNIYGQLGARRILLGNKKTYREVVMDPRMLTEAEQPTTFHQGQVLPAWALPPGFEDMSKTNKPVTGPANRGIFVRPGSQEADGGKVKVDGKNVEIAGIAGIGGESTASSRDVNPFVDIRFCTALHEIQTLRDVNVVQIAAGNEHSVVRTHTGKVLGWGRQTHGQTGLSTQIALEAIPKPTEIVLSKAFPNSSVDIECTDIAAGADNTFFTMRRREPGSRGGVASKVDVLAVGKGQWGTLGNAMWNQVTITPARVKTISGLQEFSERTQKTHAVPVHTVSVGKPGSVAVVLDTVEQEGHQAFGRDVMVFGHNAGYQLGTGKRSNLAVPQHLQPLPPPTTALGLQAPPVVMITEGRLKEADINSGVLTHMPHHRLQLASQSRGDTRAARVNDDRPGKVKRGVDMEETITAGAVSMAIFWKVQQP